MQSIEISVILHQNIELMNSFVKKLIPKMIGKSLNLSSYPVPKWTVNQVFKLFGTPRIGRIRPKDKVYLDTCESSGNLTTKFGTIQHYMWNEKGAQTILLLHGWESNAARWQSLTKYLLKENFCVLVIDAPAHGDSSNSEFDMFQYIAAIDKAVQQFKPSMIAGHSLGGASLGFYLSEYNFPSFTKMVFMGSPTELSKMMEAFSNALGLSKRVLRLLDQLFIEKFKITIDSISAAKFVKEVDIPTLIIHDLDDQVIPVENAKEYHKLIRNSKLVITEGYGHRLQHKVVFKEIINFLKED